MTNRCTDAASTSSATAQRVGSNRKRSTHRQRSTSSPLARDRGAAGPPPDQRLRRRARVRAERPHRGVPAHAHQHRCGRPVLRRVCEPRTTELIQRVGTAGQVGAGCVSYSICHSTRSRGGVSEPRIRSTSPRGCARERSGGTDQVTGRAHGSPTGRSCLHQYSHAPRSEARRTGHWFHDQILSVLCYPYGLGLSRTRLHMGAVVHVVHTGHTRAGGDEQSRPHSRSARTYGSLAARIGPPGGRA